MPDETESAARPDGDDDASDDALDDGGRPRRRHPRAEIPLLVQYRIGALDTPRIDYALNISAGGLLLRTDDDYPVGTSVFVQITTRDGQHLLQGEGTVVRNAGGCAIELTGFDAAAREVLRGVVDRARAEAERG